MKYPFDLIGLGSIHFWSILYIHFCSSMLFLHFARAARAARAACAARAARATRVGRVFVSGTGSKGQVPANATVDCAGVCDGRAYIDRCGICGGNNKDMDCMGVCFGKAVCAGDTAVTTRSPTCRPCPSARRRRLLFSRAIPNLPCCEF